MTIEEAINQLQDAKDGYQEYLSAETIDMAIKALEQEPKPIDYYDCSSAMLKLWMENIVTDSEYYRIVDKLNAKHKEGKI